MTPRDDGQLVQIATLVDVLSGGECLPTSINEYEYDMDEKVIAITNQGFEAIEATITLLTSAISVRSLFSGLITSSVAMPKASILRVRQICLRVTAMRHVFGNVVIADALRLLSKYATPEDILLARAFLCDDSPYVVTEAIRLLSVTIRQLSVIDKSDLAGVLRVLSHHGSPIVRQAVADCAADEQLASLMPDLRRLTSDRDENVREAASTALGFLEDIIDKRE